MSYMKKILFVIILLACYMIIQSVAMTSWEFQKKVSVVKEKIRLGKSGVALTPVTFHLPSSRKLERSLLGEVR